MTPTPSPTLIFCNALLFDSPTGTMRPQATVVVAGDRVTEVRDGSEANFGSDGAGGHPPRVVDLQGRALLPGLIDAHVHVTATSTDLFRLSLQPQSLTTAQTKDILEAMLMRGYTTVRDAAGADSGIVQAVERGHFVGPRLFIAGRAISQTGGHGDARPAYFGRGHAMGCVSCGAAGILGAIADGVGEVRRAVREELRNGAHHIKVMAGGGVASPSDPLEGTQYSIDEMTAIVEEARAARTYVMAHAYSPESIARAVHCGVRSIEHGNLLDEPTAALMAEHGVFLVPTLATYDALYRNADRLGWSGEMLAKLDSVRTRGVDAIRIAHAAGVRIGYGTDLLGEMHAEQSIEYALRAPAMPAAEILRSATAVNAELLGRTGELGVVAPGALADLVVVDGDPTRDLSLMQAPAERFLMVVKSGRIYKDLLRGGAR